MTSLQLFIMHANSYSSMEDISLKHRMQFPTAVVSLEQDLPSLCTQSLNFLQFAEAYKNLQNITRRHIHVHEPLIYDSVLVAALAMHVSLPTLRLFGLNYTVNHEFIERLIQHNLQRYYFTGLTVSCTCTPCIP